MSQVDEHSKKIMERATCICEICQQVGWRKCENHTKDPDCDQLIQKFVDHDHGWQWKNKKVGDKLFTMIKVAGVLTPGEVMLRYRDHIIKRMVDLKIPSRRFSEETKLYIYESEKGLRTGLLEEERAALHMAVLQSVGFMGRDMSPAARIFVRVLEQWVEHYVKRTNDLEEINLRDYVDRYVKNK